MSHLEVVRTLLFFTAILAGPFPCPAQVFSPAQMVSALPSSHGFGAIDTNPHTLSGYTRAVIGAQTPVGRPASIVLTEFLPPVGEQGHTYSGVGWAVGYYLYTYAVAKDAKLTPEQVNSPTWEFSPGFLWHQRNSGMNRGMEICEAMDLLSAGGCATLKTMPWSDQDLKSQPGPGAKAEAAVFKARRTVLISEGGTSGERVDINKIKTWLYETRTPVVVGLTVFDDNFLAPPHDVNYIYSPASKNILGTQALTVIGYDDARHAFRIVNSWGRDWADGGFLWLSEGYVLNNGRDCWGVVGGGPRARSVPDVLPDIKFVEPDKSQPNQAPTAR